jgi:hypothetical protein
MIDGGGGGGGGDDDECHYHFTSSCTCHVVISLSYTVSQLTLIPKTILLILTYTKKCF